MKKYQQGGNVNFSYQNDPILQQLQGLGMQGQNWWEYTPQDVASAIGSTYGIAQDKLTPAMFGGFTPQEYAMTQASYYNPMIQSGTQGFLGDYISNVSKTASAAAGGFAGSAGVNTATSKLRDEYGKKVSDLIGQTTQMQQQQQKSVLDKIQTFKDTGRSLKYG